ncbi:MAG: hypothetical protein IJG33_15690 [Selenomonadaceae bacterium]|nr:hypothetical protein [Selenomonadaceae bacterium]
MIRKFIAACVLILFASSATALAADEPRIIQVTGVGGGPAKWDQHDSFYKTFARQAARMDALRQLAESIGSIRVQSKTTVDPDGKLKEDIVKVKTELIHNSKVFKLLKKNARQVGKARFEDGVCYVDMEIVVPADWRE